MPASHDIKGIIRRVAEIIIDELKLEDVTVDPQLKTIRLISEYIKEKLPALN